MASQPDNYRDQLTYLWRLLFLYFVRHSIEEVMQLAASMYDQKFDFSVDFEKLVLKLWETGDIAQIYEIAMTVVQQRLFDSDIKKHIFIVATLVEQGKLSIDDAAQMLNIGTSRNYATLDARVQRVIDVTWLVNEDSKDRIMSPSDDSILAEALKDATTLFEERSQEAE